MVNKTMLAPAIRNLLRYAIGAAVAEGLVSQAVGDALGSSEVLNLAAAVVAAALVEGYYYLAKRRGWST